MIRYRRLSYVALNVSDVDRMGRFYEDIVGLQPVPSTQPGARFFRCSDKHHDVVLYRGEPGLKRIGFELESEAEIAPLAAALEAAGVAWQPISPSDQAFMKTGRGIRLVEPSTQATFDFFASMQETSAPYAFTPTLARIERLGHIVLKAADYEGAVAFFTGVLNFRLSDGIDGAVSFLRCFPNPLHHSLGLANGHGVSSLHHVNFMVSDIDDIGSGMWRFRQADVPIVWGPGRHPPSSSVFLYALDPDGITFEYSFGMEEFAEEGARPPRDLPLVPESLDTWGAPIDPRKNRIGSIERPPIS